MLDFMAILQERWFLVVGLAIVLFLYLFSMDFRRFLAIVPLVMILHLMWESISIASFFPYSSLHYISPENLDYYMMLIPFSPIVLKSLVYMSGSYIVASMVGKKYTVNKVDMVLPPRKKIGEAMLISSFASILSTLSVTILEPVLVNSLSYGFGPYEEFTVSGFYFGVNPMYFAGWLASSFCTFSLTALGESNIEFKTEKILFEYEDRVQKPSKYQEIGFLVFILGLIIPAFMSIYIDVVLFFVNFFIIFPIIIILMLWFSKWASEMDDKSTKEYCIDHLDSSICKDLE